MSMPWFRMYAEWASDPVVQTLSFDDQRHHAVLLCLKCNGTLDREISDAHRERIVVRGLGLDPVAAGEVKRRLLEVGLIDENWQPNGWDKRQFISDVSTQRVRNYRNKNKSRNVSETSHETVGNSSGNGPYTEQIQNRTDTEDLHIGFESSWKRYPKRAGNNVKKDALRCWNARLKEGFSEKELSDAIDRYLIFCQHTGKIGTEFVMQASTFFGPKEKWKQDWSLPKEPPGRKPTVLDYRRNLESKMK